MIKNKIGDALFSRILRAHRCVHVYSIVELLVAIYAKYLYTEGKGTIPSIVICTVYLCRVLSNDQIFCSKVFRLLARYTCKCTVII